MAFRSLIDVMRIPPGGWKYRQAETDTELKAGDYYNLVDKVRRHRHLNLLPSTTDLEREVQAQICERLAPAARAIYCRDDTAYPVEQKPSSVQFDEVKHFLGTLKRLRNFVPQAEANRRAEICAACPRNTVIVGCSACRNLVGLVFNVIGNRRTPLDHRLKACGVCSCELQTAVHIPLEAFPAKPEYQYPDWCWRAKTAASVSAPAV